MNINGFEGAHSNFHKFDKPGAIMTISKVHLEKKRVEAIYAFAKIRKGIDKLSKLSHDQDSKKAESLAVNSLDELCYLERLFNCMLDHLVNQE